MTKINATGHLNTMHLWHDKDTTGITTQPSWKRPPCQAWASHLRPALRRQKRKDQELKISLVMWWVQGQPGPQRNPASKKTKRKDKWPTNSQNPSKVWRSSSDWGLRTDKECYMTLRQENSMTSGKSNKHSIWSEEVLWCVFGWLHILYFLKYYFIVALFSF